MTRGQDIARTPARVSVLAGMPCLRITGAFALILMLLFSPSGLTAIASGDAQFLTPFEQTLLTMVEIVIILGALIAFGTHGRGSRLDGILVPLSLCTTIVALVLIPLVKTPIIPVIVALLLSVSGAIQLYLGAHVCSKVTTSSMTVWTSIALLCAVAVTTIADRCFARASMSTFFVGSVILICGVAYILSGRRTATDGRHPDSVADADRPDASMMETHQGRQSDLLVYDWQPLLGGAICALSFGFAWNWPFQPFQYSEATLPLIGRFLGCIILIAVFARMKARPASDPSRSSDSFSYLLSMAAALGILVWSVGNGDYTSSVLFLFASISQVLFLDLLWVETLLTGRESDDTAAIPCLGIIVFLAVFIVGSLASVVLPFSITTIIIPMLLLVYIYSILVSALRRSHRPVREVIEAESYDDMFDDICHRMAEDFSLSRRETEILPLLVLGLSATTIGERLFISPQTVKSHSHRVYTKMSIHSHEELVEIFNRYSR